MKKAVLLGSLFLVGAALAQGATVTVGGYGGNIDPPLVNDLINKFVKPKVPNVTVQYVPIGDPYAGNLTNQLSAGTAPDVFYLPDSSAAGLIESGRVLALNGLPGINLSDFVSSLQTPYTVNGKVYGIAKDFNTLALYYNKDLFDQAKVQYPSANDTWTTFEDKITRVQKALGPGYYGLCVPSEYARFGAFAAATGWKPFDAQGKTNLLDARFVRAMTYYTGLEKKKVAVQPAEISAGWGGDCFKSGKVATALEGAWMLGFLRDQAPNLQYGATSLPKDPQTGKSGNLLYSVAWAINANTKNRDAAIRVLNALTAPEAQSFILEGGLALPSRKALQTSPYFKKTTPEAQANLVVFRNANDPNTNILPFTARTFGDDWFRPINEALKSIMDDQASVDAALRKAQATINALK